MDWFLLLLNILIESLEGKSALQMTFNELPDLILLDMSLPGKNGLTLLRKLCKSNGGRY